MIEAGTTTEDERMWDVLILGGGPAGATAALYTARAGWETLVVDKSLTAGALGMTSKITNYPGVGDHVTGAQLVERIRAQAIEVGATFVVERITASTLTAESKTLVSSRGLYRARAVIVATGSMGRSPSIPGEARLVGHGVSYCATCDGFFFSDQDVVVIGHSDEALEEALHVARFARHVLIASSSPKLRDDGALIQQVKAHERITLRLSLHVREILGAHTVEGVVVEADGAQETLPASGVFVYLQGGKPILDFAGKQLKTTTDGCLQVDDQFQTSVPGVFAAGDVLCKHIKQAVIAASEGAQAAIAVDRLLSGRTSLKPDWA
jgi:thioredoxin reductase (NADPH)